MMANHRKEAGRGQSDPLWIQILPKMLQEWCKGHNLQTARVGMTPGMRKVSEMKNVSSLELVDIVEGGVRGTTSRKG